MRAFCLATLLAAAASLAPVFAPRVLAQEEPETPLDEAGFNERYAERVNALYRSLTALDEDFPFTTEDLRDLIERDEDLPETAGVLERAVDGDLGEACGGGGGEPECEAIPEGIELEVARRINELRAWRQDTFGTSEGAETTLEGAHERIRAFGARALENRVRGLEAIGTLDTLENTNQLWLLGSGGSGGITAGLQARVDTLTAMLASIREDGSLSSLTEIYSAADEAALFALARNLNRGALTDEQIPLDDTFEDTNNDGVLTADERQKGILTQNEEALLACPVVGGCVGLRRNAETGELSDDRTGVLSDVGITETYLRSAARDVAQLYDDFALRLQEVGVAQSAAEAEALRDDLRDLAARVDGVLVHDFGAMNALLDEVDRGIAMAMALSGLSVSTNRAFKAALSSGVYRSEVAMAAQFGWRLDRNIVLNGGFGYTFADQRLSGRLGVNFQW